MNVDVKFK